MESTAPIKLRIRLEDRQGTIDGDVSVELKNGNAVYEIKEKIEIFQSAEQDGKEKMDFSNLGIDSTTNGLRRRGTADDGSSGNTDLVGNVETTESPLYFPSLGEAKQAAQNIAQKVLDATIHHNLLPDWLKDNEYLLIGHRPQIQSFSGCFRSIFRIHTETGNIWTHMLGFIAFVLITAYFMTRPVQEVQWEQKLIIIPFFFGAIACLGMSFVFHTFICHSERVGKLFSKLDYVGILLLTVGSFVPWLHYGFYCSPQPKYLYTMSIIVLGCVSLVVILWDKFSHPKFRTLRAIIFAALGLSGVFPFVHFLAVNGYHPSLLWLIVMAALYLFGATLYAARVPERFLPGKCDIWFQSHQLHHLCVVAAAIAHFRGIMAIAQYRLMNNLPCQTW